MPSLSCGRICLASMDIASRSSGISSCIEPELSMRKTKLDGGRSVSSVVFPWIPTSRSWRCAFHGHWPISKVAENFPSPGGCG